MKTLSQVYRGGNVKITASETAKLNPVIIISTYLTNKNVCHEKGQLYYTLKVKPQCVRFSMLDFNPL